MEEAGGPFLEEGEEEVGHCQVSREGEVVEEVGAVGHPQGEEEVVEGVAAGLQCCPAKEEEEGVLVALRNLVEEEEVAAAVQKALGPFQPLDSVRSSPS